MSNHDPLDGREVPRDREDGVERGPLDDPPDPPTGQEIRDRLDSMPTRYTVVSGPPIDYPTSDPMEEVEKAKKGLKDMRTLSTKRAQAGSIGATRQHELVRKGRLYEEEKGLSPARQRLKQLAELGRRYEEEHGEAKPRSGTPRRRYVKRGTEFTALLEALLPVVKSTHRPKVLKLLEALTGGPA